MEKVFKSLFELFRHYKIGLFVEDPISAEGILERNLGIKDMVEIYPCEPDTHPFVFSPFKAYAWIKIEDGNGNISKKVKVLVEGLVCDDAHMLKEGVEGCMYLRITFCQD